MGHEDSERLPPLPLGICGLPTLRNRGAMDLSPNGLAAVANGNDVMILDTTHLSPIVVLPSEHKSSVNRVLWNPHARPILSEKPDRQPRDLISTDTSNTVIFWDVERCQQISSFSHSDNRPLLSVNWSSGADTWQKTKLFLLYSGNVFVVLDVMTCAYQNILIAESIRGAHEISVFDFDCDPCSCNFSSSLAFLSENTLYFVNHWDPLKMKQDKIMVTGKVSLVKSSSASPIPHNSTDAPLQNKRHSSTSGIRKLVSDIIVGSDYPNQNSQNAIRPDGAVQFHPNLKDHVIVSNCKEIHLINTYFKVILHTFSVERTCSSLVQVLVSHKRPAILTVHENGQIFLRKYVISGTHTYNVNLDTVCCNDAPRLSSKKPEVLGVMIDRNKENTVVLHLCDGRFLRYEIVKASKADKQDQNKLKHFSTPMTPFVPMSAHEKEHQGARDITIHNQSDQKFEIEEDDIFKNLSLEELLKTILEPETDAVRFKLKKGTMSLGTLTCVQSRISKDLIIAGTSNGFILVINIKDTGVHRKCIITKRFLVHSSAPVCGIEFISDTEIISYANLSFSANPKCEMTLTEISTGSSRVLKQDDSFHIGVIQISPLKQYFVLVYKNGMAPCELWDIPRRQLIKTLPTKLPPITCAVWKEATEGSREETFYLTDLGTLLFTFRTERSRFSNATCVKLDTGNHAGGIPVSLIAKGKLVYRADSSGTLVIYDTDKKAASPGVIIGRGPLLGIYAGLGNSAAYFVAHFNDQVELWNLSTVKKICTLNSGKSFKAQCVCWMNGYLVTIPRSSGGIKFLLIEDDNRMSIPSRLFSSYQYFLPSSARCRRLLSLKTSGQAPVNKRAAVELFEELCAFEEASFWRVVVSNLDQTTKTDYKPNDKCFGIFSDNRFYTEVFVKLAQCVWFCDITKREEVAKALLWAGEVEKAAEILLDTEPSDPVQYIANGMKAALSVGSSSLPESSKAVLKIVATNLIASGEAEEGLEMLCLLSKHTEAAKYVESANDWGKAILLSKTSQNLKQTTDSLGKYGQFLNSHRHVLKSACVYAYIGKFDRSIEVLFGGRQRHLCYLLLLFCEQNHMDITGLSDHVKLAIALDFARFIFDCGLIDDAIKFCEEIGEDGKDLKSELEILSS